MKTRIFLAAILILGFVAITFSQERTAPELQTIFGNSDNKISHGGYGAISIGWTQIDNQNVMTLGGRAGWVIDHHITLGLAGKAFMSQIFIEGFPDAPENGLYLSGGYGGFFIEPIIFPNFPVHISIPIIIGGGGFVLNEYPWHSYSNDYEYYEPVDWDSYFVFEPGVEIELNVIKFFRVGFGASYRLTTDMHVEGLQKDMMNGFNAAVTLKFGKF